MSAALAFAGLPIHLVGGLLLGLRRDYSGRATANSDLHHFSADSVALRPHPFFAASPWLDWINHGSALWPQRYVQIRRSSILWPAAPRLDISLSI